MSHPRLRGNVGPATKPAQLIIIQCVLIIATRVEQLFQQRALPRLARARNAMDDYNKLAAIDALGSGAQFSANL